MSKINKSDIHDFINGEIVQDVTLDQVVELLRTALNDNYDRLIKQYQIITAAGAIKTTQTLDTVINTFKLKESANVTLQLDPATSTVTISTTGLITSDTFDFHKTSADHDNRYYTESEVDVKLGQVAAGNPADRSIPGVKLQANTITAAELSTAYAKDVANGVPGLDAGGLISPARIPANSATTTESRTLRLRTSFGK